MWNNVSASNLSVFFPKTANNDAELLDKSKVGYLKILLALFYD